MKPKFLAFPCHLVLASSAVMAVFSPLSTFAADFTWKGSVDSKWTDGGNWLLFAAPAYGSTFSSDRLFIGSGGANAGAVFDPAAESPAVPLETTFGSTTVAGAGRGIVIGSSTQGPAGLTINSGTLIIRSNTNGSGNEPIMANGVNATLLLDGGNLDLTGHPIASSQGVND